MTAKAPLSSSNADSVSSTFAINRTNIMILGEAAVTSTSGGAKPPTTPKRDLVAIIDEVLDLLEG
eukprot:CAMPEP_0117011268 /NCGR_PEP_ID=MMETSP0472-20121206/9725_1 /TAXON_ID=693140 ORGANISM="Tiarina fusus, Strain LIS" /NCGR_SAMPLE_ID=MMETSP0472 /ASSEMBLY_ACC=CAM_ASM_000603 /LENGTH=64 /DNA_ID=CAMNT_0004714021 /DNA_START=69 /DNA_END=263 /DNA_ORIENTATION=-